MTSNGTVVGTVGVGLLMVLGIVPGADAACTIGACATADAYHGGVYNVFTGRWTTITFTTDGSHSATTGGLGLVSNGWSASDSCTVPIGGSCGTSASTTVSNIPGGSCYAGTASTLPRVGTIASDPDTDCY